MSRNSTNTDRGSRGGWMVLLVILAIIGALVLIPAFAAIVGAVLHVIIAVIGALVAAVIGLFGAAAILVLVLLPALLLIAIGFLIGRARRKD